MEEVESLVEGDKVAGQKVLELKQAARKELANNMAYGRLGFAMHKRKCAKI